MSLNPYGEQVRLQGKDLLLAPRPALIMRLLLHELATNAVKHGALGVPGGRVEVAWKIGRKHFRLSWRESGGPAVSAPARRVSGRLCSSGRSGTSCREKPSCSSQPKAFAMS